MKVTELDLFEILDILRRRALWILFFGICGGALLYLYTVKLVVPMYSASASLYVYGDQNYEESETQTSNDMSLGTRLAAIYIVLLQSDTVLDSVADQLELSYSGSDIREMMTAETIDESMAISVTIRNSDPVKAQMIANAIVDVAPAEIIRVVKAGGVEVIDYAKLPTTPYNINLRSNVQKGVLIGLAFAVLLFLLLEFLDTTVYREEDLQEHFEFPVLGSIPDIPVGGVKGKNSLSEGV
ncbi:MAG: hypothetical protein LIO86_06560 [Lachnospiraceae bacterium]|nr:hypothetical protein [Lachnospiraceae bacterium]